MSKSGDCPSLTAGGVEGFGTREFYSALKFEKGNKLRQNFVLGSRYNNRSPQQLRKRRSDESKQTSARLRHMPRCFSKPRLFCLCRRGRECSASAGLARFPDFVHRGRGPISSAFDSLLRRLTC